MPTSANFTMRTQVHNEVATGFVLFGRVGRDTFDEQCIGAYVSKSFRDNLLYPERPHRSRVQLLPPTARPGRTDSSRSRRAPIRGGDIDGQGRRVLPLQQEPPRPAPSPPPHRRDRTFIPPPPRPIAPAPAPAPAPPAPSPRPVRIYVVFYSMYGHVRLLARAVQRGVGSVPGAFGVLLRVPETLPRAVLARMGALKPAAEEDEIPLVDPDGLPDADGFLFGFPARYGAMAAQMQAFFDSTAPLCRHQRLAGKPAGFFVSTGTQCGGQETTAWTAITQLAHHGMMFVPIGYTFGEWMFEMEELRGGSPYGAGVLAGDGSRPPSDLELALAEHHGKYMATLVKRMVHGADAG